MKNIRKLSTIVLVFKLLVFPIFGQTGRNVKENTSSVNGNTWVLNDNSFDDRSEDTVPTSESVYEFVIAQIAGGGLSAAQIKTLYESNANTNAFTDTLLSKLNAIAAGAEVNLDGAETVALLDAFFGNTDWRTGGGGGTDDQTASEVPVTDSGGFYTATDVEGVQQEQGPLIAANTAKRSYPTGDETKLGTIESGAEVNLTGSEMETLLDAYFGNTDWRTQDGTGTDDQTASEVSVSTSNFVGNFQDDPAYNTLQKLAEIIDGFNLAGSGSVNTSGSPVSGDWARFTDPDTVEGLSDAELIAALSLEVDVDIQAHLANLAALESQLTVDFLLESEFSSIANLNTLLSITGSPTASTVLYGDGRWAALPADDDQPDDDSEVPDNITVTGSVGAATVNATGFDGNLGPTDNTVQEIAQALDDLIDDDQPDDDSEVPDNITVTGSVANATVNATGFDGNLGPTDNTMQEIAQALDDFTAGATLDIDSYGTTATESTVDTDDYIVISVDGVEQKMPLSEVQDYIETLTLALENLSITGTFSTDTFGVNDTVDQSHYLSFTAETDYDANRQLQITTSNADTAFNISDQGADRLFGWDDTNSTWEPVVIGSGLAYDGTTLTATATGDALVANPLSQFAATTSAQLAATVSNETGSGLLVFGTSPNIVTPTGIVKGDVGLGNVDNTSDATKNSATATLTNKTIVFANNTLTNVMSTSTAQSIAAGIKKTFQANGTTAGFRLAGVTSNPSSLTAGDMWYRSDSEKILYRGTSLARTLVTEGLAQTLVLKTLTNPTINASVITGVNDAGGASSFEIPNSASPTVDVVGEIAVDSDFFGANKGAIISYNGTEQVVFIPILASDTPTAGQVPKYNASGYYTNEDDSTGSGSLGSNLSSSTNDITSDNEAIALAGTTEDLVITFSSDTATTTSTTGVATFNFGALQPQFGGNDLLDETSVKYRTEFIPVGWMEDGASAPAAIETFSDTRKVDIRKFDSTASEDLEYYWALPEDAVDAVAGGDWQLKARVKFIITEATEPATGEGASWAMSGVPISSGDDIGAASLGTEINMAIADLDANIINDEVASPWVEITLTGATAGDSVYLNFNRDVADADDDYGQDLGVIGIELKYAYVTATY